jgi:type II secretory pathway component GspD/PulD (secretin)
MFFAHSGPSVNLVCLTAAAALAWQNPAGDLPITRLSGDTPAQSPAPRPSQPPLSPIRGLPVTRIDDRGHSTDLDAPQRLTLAFAAPAPVRDVLLLLVKGTPFSTAIDPDVNGTFMGELKEVTLRQAIESVMAPNHLAYDVNGTVLHVYAQRMETRLFDLNLVNLERTWQRTLKTDDGMVLTARVPGGDTLDEIASGVRALLSDAGRAHIDRHAGLAQVTDYAERLDRVSAYVEALQLRGSRQIRLQARILEVTLKNAASIDWRAARARLGLPERATLAGLAVDPVALQTALAAQGDVQVVAAPDLLVLNNEPAVVRTVTPGTSTLALTVIPQIAADRIVQLNVSPSWSSRESDASVGISEADTVVRVLDGSTAVISGFLHVDERARATSGSATALATEPHQRITKEVVVLLTPTVVNAGSAAPAAR